MNTEIQGDHKKYFKISSEEYIGFGNNHLPSKPVNISFMKKNTNNSENDKNQGKYNNNRYVI